MSSACQNRFWREMSHVCQPRVVKSGTVLKIGFRNVVVRLIIVLNCQPHVFTGVRRCIKNKHVVVTAGHLQVPCAVERLIGFLVDRIDQLGMF